MEIKSVDNPAILRAFTDTLKNRFSKMLNEIARKLETEYSVDAQDTLDVWNKIARDFQIAKEAPPAERKKSAGREVYGTCKALLKSGPKSGQECGAKIRIEGSEYCRRHLRLKES